MGVLFLSQLNYVKKAMKFPETHANTLPQIAMPLRNQLKIFIALFCGLALGGQGCGYTFQTSRSSYSDEGLQRVYIQRIKNLTDQPGAEDVVYNSLLRAILAKGRWKVVGLESAAEVILSGSVNSATYSVAGLQQVQNLQPSGIGSNFSTKIAKIPAQAVAQSYSAVLSCQFMLRDARRPVSKNPTLWTNTFTRTKPFPSANQLDVPGTTSSLINQSEFERAMVEMATLIAADAEESMFSRF